MVLYGWGCDTYLAGQRKRGHSTLLGWPGPFPRRGSNADGCLMGDLCEGRERKEQARHSPRNGSWHISLSHSAIHRLKEWVNVMKQPADVRLFDGEFWVMH